MKETAATKADLAATKADLLTAISKTKSKLLTWQIGIAFALFCALKLIH